MKKLLFMLLALATIAGADTEDYSVATPENNYCGFGSQEKYEEKRGHYDEACKELGVTPGVLYGDPKLIERDNALGMQYGDTGNIAIDTSYRHPDYKYGARRHTIFHEVTHKKQKEERQAQDYKASRNFGLWFTASMLSSMRRKPWASTVLLMTIPLFAKLTKSDIFTGAPPYTTETNEADADRRGAIALKCAECVEDKANYRGDEPPSGGYLSKKELHSIADMHRANNLSCPYHINLPKSWYQRIKSKFV